MRVCALTLVLSSVLLADDPPQLVVALKAQTDFDRVAMTPIPRLADTGACLQSHAALLSVSLPEEMSLVYYRKAYCTLAQATIKNSNRDFLATAVDFDRSIEAWPARRTRKS